MKKLTIVFALLVTLLTGCSSDGFELEGAWDCIDFEFSAVFDEETCTIYGEYDVYEYDYVRDGNNITLSSDTTDIYVTIEEEDLYFEGLGTFVKVDEPSYDGSGTTDYKEDESEEEVDDIDFWYGDYICGESATLTLEKSVLDASLSYDINYTDGNSYYGCSGTLEVIEGDIYTIIDDSFTFYYNDDGSITVEANTDDEDDHLLTGI